MSASSHFSDETQSVMDPPPGDESNEWGWMEPQNEDPSQVRHYVWWRRPRIFYPTLVLVVAAMLGLCVTAFLFGMDGLSGWKPNQSNASGGSSPPADEGNVQGTDGGLASLEPTASPTKAPTAFPTNAPTDRPTMGPRTVPLSFYVMGDVPYAPWEERVLSTQIANLTASRHPGSAFLVHCGDMMKAERSGCERGYYQHVRNILSMGPLPTFVLAGDNDSLDCASPTEAWNHYTETFTDFDEEWSYRLPAGVPTLGVERWLLPVNVPLEQNDTRWTTRPEMFAFTEDGILFMSVTLLHVPDDQPPDGQFQERLADSRSWVTQQVAQATAEQRARGERIRGVVMFGHARIAGYLRPFFMELKQVFMEALVLGPVLYIHGDGHKFSINDNFGPNIGWNQFVDIQVDQGAYADPLLVEVALSNGGIMQQLTANNPNQFIVGNGLFRIDRQRGRYPSIEDEDVRV